MTRTTSSNPVIDFFGQDNAEALEKTDGMIPAVEIDVLRKPARNAIAWFTSILGVAGTVFAAAGGAVCSGGDMEAAAAMVLFACASWGAAIWIWCSR